MTNFKDATSAVSITAGDKLLLARPDGGGDFDPMQIDPTVLADAVKSSILKKTTPASTKWRVRAGVAPYSRDVNLGFGLAELKFLDGSSTNLCTGGTGIYSTSIAGSGFAYTEAFNNSTASLDGWYASSNQAGSNDAWLGYQFATAQLPVQVSICPLNGYENSLPAVLYLEFFDVTVNAWVKIATLSTATPVANTYQTFSVPTTYDSTISYGTGNQWVGKKMYAVGDSIVAATDCWADRTATLLGCTLGKIATSGWKASDAKTAVLSANTADADLMVVAIGTNDFGNNTAMGALGDTSASATFYGYYEDLVTNALNDRKTTRLVLVTPFHRSGDTTPNTASKTLRDYCDAIVAIGRKYGVPVYDAYDKSGVGPLTLTTFLSDGLHPNTAGTDFLSFRFAGLLATI